MISYEKRPKKFKPVYNVAPEVIEENYQRVLKGQPLTIPLRHLGDEFKTRCRAAFLKADTRRFFKCIFCGKVIERKRKNDKRQLCSAKCRLEQRRKVIRDYYYNHKEKILYDKYKKRVETKRFIKNKFFKK